MSDEKRSIEIFPDLRSKIVFSVQTERSELLRKDLEELGDNPVGGLQQMEEMALGLAISLIEDRLRYSKEVKRLKEKVAHLLVKEIEVARLMDRRSDVCGGCGDELLIFDEGEQGRVQVYCEACEYEMTVEV